MSTDCLVTKLKGNVDNNTLPKLGEFAVDAVLDLTLTADSSAGVKIRTIDGTITYNGSSSKEVTIVDNNPATLQEGAKYFIHAPYSLSHISLTATNKGSKVDYDAVLYYRKYSNRLILQELDNKYGSYDIDKCVESLSTIPGELTLSYLYDLSGNISAFSVLSANWININGTQISGDIANMLAGYHNRITPIDTVQVVSNGVITFGQTMLQKGNIYTFTYSNGEWSYTVA